MGFAERLPDGSTSVTFKRLVTGPDCDAWDLTGRVGLALEEEVLSRPEQWLWIFRRQPALPAAPFRSKESARGPAEVDRPVAPTTGSAAAS